MNLDVEYDSRGTGLYYHKQPHGTNANVAKIVALRDMGFKRNGKNIVVHIGREAEILAFAKLIDFEFIPFNDCDSVLWR